MTKSILIIDDDEQLRTVLRVIFEDLTYTVYEASNGKEGIESFRKKPADIVITDIFMPEKDGLETIRDLKKEFPEIKIVAMSGVDKGSVDFLRVARLFGATFCIKKPFDPEEIIDIVNQALDANPTQEHTQKDNEVPRSVCHERNR